MTEAKKMTSASVRSPFTMLSKWVTKLKLATASINQTGKPIPRMKSLKILQPSITRIRQTERERTKLIT